MRPKAGEIIIKAVAECRVLNSHTETAHAALIKTASALARRRQAYVDAVGLWGDSWVCIAVRQVVETVIDIDSGPLPPMRTVAGRMRDLDTRVATEQVHDQSWRDHLASSASPAAMAEMHG